MFREFINQIRVGRQLVVPLFVVLFAVFMIPASALAAPAWSSQNFVTKWKVDGKKELVLPINGKVSYACYEENYSSTVTLNTVKDYNEKEPLKITATTLPTAKPLENGKTYIVEIKVNAGTFSIFMEDGSRECLRDVLNWGSKVTFNTLSGSFKSCTELTQITANDFPTGFTVLANVFSGCAKLSKINNLGKWPVSNVTNMRCAFENCTAFKGEGLEKWRPVNCENFVSTFGGCDAFNPDLSDWKTSLSKARDVQGMFRHCISFKGTGLDEWNVSQVRNFTQMFYECFQLAFNPANWNVRNARNMDEMFRSCSALDNIVPADFTNWGSQLQKVKSFYGMFNGCKSFKGTGIASWMPLGNATENISYMFNECAAFDQNLGNWDVSKVKTMKALFRACTKFKGQDLEKWANKIGMVEDMAQMFTNVTALATKFDDWQVGNVKDMSSMFQNANVAQTNFVKWDVGNCENFAFMFAYGTSPIKGLSKWNVRKGVDFTSMFAWKTNFNEDLKSWKLLRARSTKDMFLGCYRFEADLKDWFVENIEDASGMFMQCREFDSNLGEWNFKKLLYMNSMFENAYKFRGEGLSRWNVSQVVNMARAFRMSKKEGKEVKLPDAAAFNGDLSRWKVANCQNFSGMFWGCYSLETDLSKWDVSKAEDLTAMFHAATNFNSDLSAWNVAKVRRMDSIFMGAFKFNSDISGWETSSLESLYNSFRDAKAFNYSLGEWDLSHLQADEGNVEITLTGCGMGVANYDRTISGWYKNAERNGIKNVHVEAKPLRYRDAKADRENLMTTTTWNWKFNDDGYSPNLLLIVEPLKVRVKKEGQKVISYRVEGPSQDPSVKCIPEGIISYKKDKANKTLTVTGVKPGLTHIRMQVSNDTDRAYDDCDVLCYIAISDFEFAQPEYRLAINDKLDLKKELSILPKDASYPDAVKFTSKDTQKAIVDEKTGVVTGLEEGEVEIEVESTDGDDPNEVVRKTIKITVHRVEVESVALIPSPSVWLGVGRSTELQVEFTPANTTDKNYTLKLSNTEVLQLEGNRVKGLKSGVCVVTVTTTRGNKTATTTVIVVDNYVPVSNVVLDKTEIEIPVRASRTLAYTIQPAKASNKVVFWTSSDPEIATVSKDGVVTGLKEGVTEVTVQSAENEDARAVCTVKVFFKEVAAITLLDKDSKISVAAGAKSTALRYKIEPEDASDLSVEWSSSNEDVVRVNSRTGELEGVAEGGPVTIKVKALGARTQDIEDSHTDVWCIRLIPTEKLELPVTKTAYIGDEFENFLPTFTPTDATDRRLQWHIERTEIATYDETTNKLTATGVGETKITVSLVSNPDIKAECTLHVLPHIYATSVALDPTAITVGIDQMYVLSVLPEPENATRVDIVWTVENNDDAIAFEESLGIIKGVKVGTATISVALKSDPEKKATCVVTVVDPVVTTGFSFDIDPAVYEINYGDKLDLRSKVVFEPSNATDRYLEWTSADEDVVSVINGVVKGLQANETGIEITAKLHSNPTLTKTCVVKVKAPIVPYEIRLNTNELKLHVDDVRTLTVKEFKPETSTDRAVKWTTSDATRVDVDANGKIIAKAVGRAFITVALQSDPTVSDICMVEVVDQNSNKLVTSFQVEDIEVTEDRTADLKVTYTPDEATDRRLFFEGVDGDSFSIIDGVVRGFKPCEPVEVTAYLVSDPAITAKFKVTVKPLVPVTDIKINHDSIILYVLNEAYLRPVTDPVGADLTGIKWTSEDPTICTVTDGIVYGVAPGTTNVKVTLNGKDAVCKVIVKPQSQSGTDDPGAGVEEDRLRALRVYPNPFADVLRFTNDELQVERFELLDAMGRVVRSANVSEVEVMIETRDLTPGFYLLRLYSASAVDTRKLVKR